MESGPIWYEQYREEKESEVEKLLRRKVPRHTAIFDREGPADKLYGRQKARIVKKSRRRTP